MALHRGGTSLVTVVFGLCLGASSASLHAQVDTRAGMTGEQLYQKACLACHGADGKGQPREVRGFETDLPDFTDCSLSTPEADLDWNSVIHLGGRARSFDRMMPAFIDELSGDEIQTIIGYLRRFCTEPGWPHGDLNLPRAFVTEKAFPENEAVLTTTIVPSHDRSVGHDFLYERRVGRRGQYEINIPLNLQQRADRRWAFGFGDFSVGYKHVLLDSVASGSIFSAGGEVTLPSGRESRGLGGGVIVMEAFGTLSQALPSDGFLHAHVGFEAPSDSVKAPKETFWRAAIGKSFMERRWGRAWSPMIEILGAREHVDAAEPEWDLLPQLQVSLSDRQHVLLNVGVRVPISQRPSRSNSVLVYLLWDWFDGGFLDGW
jgi:hypothetical protein